MGQAICPSSVRPEFYSIHDANLESGHKALKKNVRGNKPQEVRINSGRLRGRKLTFPSVEGLRPTLGRSRETLFNWLRPMLPDATCLDLFAGSGVLGMEAASVGAAQVVLVEQHAETAKHLAQSIETLNLRDTCTLEIADARSFLKRCHSPFDVIFVDPPFADTGLMETAVTSICESRLLGQWLYLEFDQQQEIAVNRLLQTHGLSLAKSAKAGATRSWLIQAR